ncbi:MAG: glucose-1-phosphate adenylyltransferase [Deltaproteobacteria bacterium RIFOXYB12_FULL_58_9]|nr:MAG: glucose-1-phosphate adenylyltransferase [Deltaproteobacteria bacterium RIFOXYB12_FULL_58_9]
MRGCVEPLAIHPDVIKQVLTLILAGGRGERLDPLTRHRSKPSVPFGGTFRIIDFVLANAVNSGLRQICLLTQYKATSLMRHINTGWNILSAELGEFIYTIPPQLRVSDHWYLGTVDAVYQNVYTIGKVRPSYVLVLSGDHVYRMDYRELIAEHIAKHAELTLAVTNVPAADSARYGVVERSAEGWVTGYKEKPSLVGGDEITANMGIFLFDTNLLIDAVSRDASRQDSRHDFGHDLIPELLQRGARVYAHRFKSAGSKPEPYWRDIGTRDAYYEANMDLVSVSPHFSLYDRTWPIRSAPIQAPPAKFVFSGGELNRVGQAHDSLVSPGGVISGGSVRGTILGPNCRVNSWATVEESILMDGVDVGRHSMVRRAIIDKYVVLPPYSRIGVDADRDRERFTVTSSGIVIVPRDAVL